MNNTLSVLFGVLMIVILTSATSFVADAASDSQSDSMITITTRNAEYVFTIELARTPEEMERGLMFRDQLQSDHGMLFLFPDEREVSFWMKNTLIPLDLIFADASGRIVRIAERAVPLSTELIPSQVPVRAVLEVNGGTAERLHITVGDKLVYPALSR